MDDFQKAKALIDNCRLEVSKRVVGQTHVIDGILMALIAGGHVLLEGVPGLAKTLTVKTISDISGFEFKRIQFTPDLLPADVSGTMIYEQATGRFSAHKGPVFTNLLLADEINRAPAKVQSALLEAMAEGQVTIGENTYELPDPFFVLATQNPIEQEGTYNLPEAELDRFLLKILLTYPSIEQEQDVVKAGGKIEHFPVNKVINDNALRACRALCDQVTCSDDLVRYIVSIVAVTRPDKDHVANAKSSVHAQDMLNYVSFGASPRASIALFKCAKVQALFEGRSFVLPEDIKKVAPAVLRHRLVLSYEAAADGIVVDDLIEKILSLMPIP